MRTAPHVLSPPRIEASATRTIAAALGVFAGISGLDHGLFEALQGETPTSGMFVHAIGPAQQMWTYGTEDAFTFIPNFLVTGILAIAVGIALSAWSIGFIDRNVGPGVFLALGILLFGVGGGVAQVVFIALGSVEAMRIGRPSRTRQHLLPTRVDRTLARRWRPLLLAALALGVVALEIAISGFVPGVTDPDRIQTICWSALGAMLTVLMLAIVGAAAYDRERTPPPPSRLGTTHHHEAQDTRRGA